MAKDFGIIGPSGAGRWVWPFREMDVGDFFHVDPQDRPIQKVRTTAYCRGYQLGFKFSTTKGENGLSRVERVDPEIAMRERAALVLEYDTVRNRLMTLYGLDREGVDGLHWSFLDIGGSQFQECKLQGEAKQRELVVDVARCRIHVELRDDGFTLTRLEDDMTLQDVLRAREEKLLLELMG